MPLFLWGIVSIPALKGQPPPGEHTRELLALPARLGGLGLTNPAASVKDQRTASQQISAPLVDGIINQDHQLDDCHSVQQSIKRRIQHMKYMKQKEDAKNLQHNLPNPLQRSIELSQEKGASTRLTALPIDEHGFALHKAAFRDSLSLRYGWPLQNSPSHCSCGQPFSVEHALTCKTGGFPAVRHNEVRDITATLLTEVCHGVTTEPHLQPLSGESLSHRSAITEDADSASHSSEPLLCLSGERDHPDTTQPLNVQLTFSLWKATSTNSLVAYMYHNLFCMPFIPLLFFFYFSRKKRNKLKKSIYGSLVEFSVLQ